MEVERRTPVRAAEPLQKSSRPQVEKRWARAGPSDYAYAMQNGASARGDGTPVKRAVAVVVRPPGQGEFHTLLLVLRPEDDEELPGVWGLPASSLRQGESWEDAVPRTGREKLGVALQPGPMLGEGSAERPGYRLHMRLYLAALVDGEPNVRPELEAPLPEGTTRYDAWGWAGTDRLRGAVSRGSLCARLALEWIERDTKGTRTP